MYCSISLQTLSPSITNVRNAIDKSLTERDSNIDKFCTHLDKDIAELGKEVKEIKQEAQVGIFIYLTILHCTNMYFVYAFLWIFLFLLCYC